MRLKTDDGVIHVEYDNSTFSQAYGTIRVEGGAVELLTAVELRELAMMLNDVANRVDRQNAVAKTIPQDE